MFNILSVHGIFITFCYLCESKLLPYYYLTTVIFPKVNSLETVHSTVL